MKKILCLISLLLPFLGCNQSTSSGKINTQEKPDTITDVNANQTRHSLDPRGLFTITGAEKILGEPAHLTDSSFTTQGYPIIYQCAFTADSDDIKAGKTGVIYFMYEQYKEILAARKVYDSIRKANENHEGVKDIHNLGDQAYFHSDGQNFYFIMVRKGDRMIRIKVNKITNTTSLNEFNLVARNITDAL